MLFLFAFCLGIMAGAGIGYNHITKASRKRTPLVKFVPNAEKEKILKELHVQIESEKACSVCGERITIENLGGILRTKKERAFFCPKSGCLASAGLVSLERKLTTIKASP